MSPRRFGKNTRLWVYRYLVLRDGEQCARCFNIPTPQNTLYGTLDIDHIDGNPFNWDTNNLRLLCHPCNVTLENKARVLEIPPSDQVERERNQGKPATRVIKEAVPYKQGSPEMQASYLCELDYRTWILGKIRELGGFPRPDAINAGAEIVGCSPSTTTKYLAKLSSSEGPLQETRDMLGDVILELKDHLKEAPRVLFHLEDKSAHPGPHDPTP